MRAPLRHAVCALRAAGFGIGEILGRQLEAVGGHGAVASAPGHGTEVQIIVPALRS